MLFLNYHKYIKPNHPKQTVVTINVDTAFLAKDKDSNLDFQLSRCPNNGDEQKLSQISKMELVAKIVK